MIIIPNHCTDHHHRPDNFSKDQKPDPSSSNDPKLQEPAPRSPSSPPPSSPPEQAGSSPFDYDITMSRDSFAALRRHPQSDDFSQLAEKHMEHDLQETDRQALRSAGSKIGSYASTGSAIGFALGILLAYRLRRGRAQVFDAFRAAEKPTHVQFVDGRTAPIPDITGLMKPSLSGDIATYGLLGLGSLFLGGEVGFATGSYSAMKSLNSDMESRRRIETAYRKFRAECLRKEADRIDGGAKLTDMISFR